MEEKEEQEIVEKLWGTPSASADLQTLEKSKLPKNDNSNLYLYDRNDKNKYNKVLIKINEKFSSVEKVDGIFELFFKDDGQLKIIECCDYYFMQSLSIEDLKQLAQYFLLVAHFMEGQNKIVNEKDVIIEEDEKREIAKKLWSTPFAAARLQLFKKSELLILVDEILDRIGRDYGLWPEQDIKDLLFDKKWWLTETLDPDFFKKNIID